MRTHACTPYLSYLKKYLSQYNYYIILSFLKKENVDFVSTLTYNIIQKINQGIRAFLILKFGT